MKLKKIFSVGIAALLLCASFAACSTKKDEDSVPTPVGTVTESEEHKVTTGLHKINVSATDKDFIANGKTEYTLVIPSDADARTRKASALVRSHLATATGVSLEVKEDEKLSYSPDKKWIVLGSDKLFDGAGLSMPKDDIGQTGYYIVSKDNSVFIAVESTFGIINGALEFLKHTIGYEMYADDTVVYTAGEVVKMSAFDVVDKPDFEFFVPSNRISVDGATGMRFMGTGDIFVPVEGQLWHNSFNYLDPNDYPDHPEWFATDRSQLCYTARGNAEYYDAMLGEFMKSMIKAVNAVTDVKNITITIQDTSTACTCEACTAERNEYGTDAAAVIKFCNSVSERLESYFEAEAEKNGGEPRELNILFFAYNKTTKPPVKKANGEFVPIDDSVVCRDNVGVYIAPITAAYNASFYSETNATTADVIKGWGTLSDKLYMWLYETNYSHYLYPLNTYDTMIETYRFCKENNAVFMMNEGQYNQGNVTCFGKLKEYFNSKAMWDVNVDYSKVCDDFFSGYFRDAAEPMRAYFDELQAHLKYLEEAYPAEINGNIYNNIAQIRFWPKRTLDHWADYIEEAYSAIEKYKASDPALYETLKKHIKLESIFIRYAQVSLHLGSYSADMLQEMRRSFKEDCAELFITMLSEAKSLDSVFSGWDL